MALPAVGEHGIDVIFGYDFANDVGCEVAVITSQRIGDVDTGKCPVLTRTSVLIDGHPFGMGQCCILVDRMWVDARHDVHSQFARAFHDRAKRIGIANEAGHVMQGISLG